MTASESRETGVGLIAIVVLGWIIGLSYAWNRIDESAGLGGAYRLTAEFNRVDGLDSGAAVMVSGVRVGTVEAMTLLPDYRARLVLQIDEDILLPKDTSAAIHTDGLFGGKYLVVDPGGDEETLRKGEMIRYTQDAVMVQDLLDLIIAEGKSLRGQAAAPEDRP